MTRELDQEPQTRRGVVASWGVFVVRLLARGYLVFVLALAACAIIPMVTGLTGAVVQSGSMMPVIRVGDVVLSRPLPADAPTPLGRVITFEAPPGSAQPGVRLHRVVDVRPDGSLITAGDANRDVDSDPLARDDIIAVSCILVPWIGLPSYWMQQGMMLPFTAWLSLSALALLIELLALRSGRGERPAARIARDREPRLEEVNVSAGKALSLVSVLLCATLIVAAPLAPSASASFTAQTTSASNSWTAAVVVAPTKLVFTTNPSNSTGGTAFATQPSVAIQGANGEPTTSTAPVTLAISTPGGAVLACTGNPLAAVSGVARFAGCVIDKVGTYTLTASAAGLSSAISATITISVGAATKLVFTATPANTARNTAFVKQPAVAMQDAGGNTVTNSTAPVTLAITGATLNCTSNPKNAVAGVATFAGCRINQTGSYVLTASSGTLTKATSAPISIFTSASALVFLVSPSGSTSNVPFGNQPVVAIRDSAGNTTSGTNAITLSITNPSGATGVCTGNPVSATNGIATFAGCAIDKAGTYTLRATASGLSSATSTSFTVSAGTASRLAFFSSPSNTTSATAFSTQPVVAVLDAFGNTTTSTAAVTLALTTPDGATLSCANNPKAAVAGVASFSGCRIDRAGSYTLTATASGMTQSISTSFSVTAGAAANVVFTASPVDSAVGVNFPVQPSVAVQDAAGNLVSTTAIVTLMITSPTGGASLGCSLNPWLTSGGVYTFSGCRIDRPGTYTLTAVSSGLGSGMSASFEVR